MILQLAYRAFPALTARVLNDRFLTPWKRLPSLARGERRTNIEVQGQRASFEVTGDGPLVILAHGWAGSSGQFADLRARLLERGLRVATFDAPAHGDSPGRTTNAAQFMRVIQRIHGEHGPTLAVLGHSLGGLAAAMSVQAVRPVGLVLLAPMPSFDFALDQFQMALRFDGTMRERVADHALRRAGVSREEARLDGGLNAGLRTLVLHDADDRRIPVAFARDLATRHPGLEYVETAGLGHSRLLVDRAVLSRVVDFVTDLRRD